MNQNLNLQNYIKVYDNVLSKDICDKLIKDSSNFEWERHSWANYEKHVDGEEKDPDVCFKTRKYNLLIKPVIKDTFLKYNLDFDFLKFSLMNFSSFRLNRYDTDTEMSSHCDHIHSLFDGVKKGIPILSLVGLLNDNFDGGDLIFWNEYVPQLKAGSVVVFPSVFLFPHRVSKVIKGERYSFVSWAW